MKYLIGFAIIFSVIVLPSNSFASPAGQFICIKKSGTLIIRDSHCKTGERLATIASITSGIPSAPTTIARTVNVSTLTQPFVTRSIYSSTASCEYGEVLSGGGCQSSDSQMLLRDAYPITQDGIQEYHCDYYNTDATITASLTAQAICLKLQ